MDRKDAELCLEAIALGACMAQPKLLKLEDDGEPLVHQMDFQRPEIAAAVQRLLAGDSKELATFLRALGVPVKDGENALSLLRHVKAKGKAKVIERWCTEQAFRAKGMDPKTFLDCHEKGPPARSPTPAPVSVPNVTE